MPRNRNHRNHQNELWKALDRLAGLASMVVVAALTYLYFQIPTWSFLPEQAREFLMALITNVIPVYILFAVSYFLFRQVQWIRSNQDTEVLARNIASEVTTLLQEEHAITANQYSRAAIGLEQIKSRDEITTANIQLIGEARQNIISFSGDLSWTTKCHQALMSAVAQNVSIRILCKDPLSEESKRHVERYFRQPGIEVKYYPVGFDPVIRGLMIDTSTAKKAVFVEKEHKSLGDSYQRSGVIGDPTNYEYWGKRLNAENDMAIVSSLAKLFEILWEQALEAEILYEGDWLAVEEKLKRIRQYQQATISVRSVKLANLRPLHRFIDVQEYERIQALAIKLKHHKIPLWNVVTIASAKSKKTLCPPIIEFHTDGQIILDGLGRVYHSRQLGESELIACVVENVSEPTIGKPWTWDRVEVVKNSAYTKTENFQNPNSDYWRSFDNVHTALERIS